jgi:HEAT repeat protein
MELVRSAIRALAQIGRAEGIPHLRAVLKRRNLLRRAPIRELRVLASEALAAIPHPAAEQVLREEATGGASELSDICSRALELRNSILPVEEGNVRA